MKKNNNKFEIFLGGNDLQGGAYMSQWALSSI